MSFVFIIKIEKKATQKLHKYFPIISSNIFMIFHTQSFNLFQKFSFYIFSTCLMLIINLCIYIETQVTFCHLPGLTEWHPFTDKATRSSVSAWWNSRWLVHSFASLHF